MSRRPQDPKWTPFVAADVADYVARMVARTGKAPVSPWDRPVAIWVNSRYEVTVHKYPVGTMPVDVAITQLSIKRRDKREIHDWRDMQRIKTEILGPTVEAVEIYPAEDRLVDTANQYHLWAFPPGERVPIGYFEHRLVVDAQHPNGLNDDGSRQRPFEDPSVCTHTTEQIQAMVKNGYKAQ